MRTLSVNEIRNKSVSQIVHHEMSLQRTKKSVWERFPFTTSNCTFSVFFSLAVRWNTKISHMQWQSSPIFRTESWRDVAILLSCSYNFETAVSSVFLTSRRRCVSRMSGCLCVLLVGFVSTSFDFSLHYYDVNEDDRELPSTLFASRIYWHYACIATQIPIHWIWKRKYPGRIGWFICLNASSIRR